MSQITLLHVFIVNEGAMMTQEEFKEEAQQLRPQLMKVARCYLDADDAEDTVQDVLLRLWQMVDELHRPLAPLALRLTRNLCVDKVRRRKTTLQLTESDDGNDTEEDERISRMMNVIDTLPDLQQTILRLRHLDGMEIREIASLTGCSEVAVRKALSRARQAVRTQYLKQYAT